MFKTKGASFGIAAALIAGTLLLSGLAISTTSGAGTDVSGPSAGFTLPFPAMDGAQDPSQASPPASPVENPTIPTDPNAGAPGAGGLGPNALPSAGFGDRAGGGAGTAFVLMVLAGVGAIGAGAAVVSGARRDN